MNPEELESCECDSCANMRLVTEAMDTLEDMGREDLSLAVEYLLGEFIELSPNWSEVTDDEEAGDTVH